MLNRQPFPVRYFPIVIVAGVLLLVLLVLVHVSIGTADISLADVIKRTHRPACKQCNLHDCVRASAATRACSRSSGGNARTGGGYHAGCYAESAG